MRRALRLSLVTATLALLAVPALAAGPKHHPRGPHRHAAPGYGPEFRLALGLFEPDGDSAFWAGNAFEFTGDAEDLEDASFSAEFVLPVGRVTGVLFSTGHFRGETVQASRDFVFPSGADILHDTELRITPLTVGLMFRPFGQRSVLTPYVGAGGGFYLWHYEEVGDFVVFDAMNQPVDIVFERFRSDGVAAGYYLMAGLDVNVSPDVSVFFEGRWSDVQDDQDDDFSGLGEIDLSGREVKIGASWKF